MAKIWVPNFRRFVRRVQNNCTMRNIDSSDPLMYKFAPHKQDTQKIFTTDSWRDER